MGNCLLVSVESALASWLLPEPPRPTAGDRFAASEPALGRPARVAPRTRTHPPLPAVLANLLRSPRRPALAILPLVEGAPWAGGGQRIRQGGRRSAFSPPGVSVLRTHWAPQAHPEPGISQAVQETARFRTRARIEWAAGEEERLTACWETWGFVRPASGWPFGEGGEEIATASRACLDYLHDLLERAGHVSLYWRLPGADGYLRDRLYVRRPGLSVLAYQTGIYPGRFLALADPLEWAPVSRGFRSLDGLLVAARWFAVGT